MKYLQSGYNTDQDQFILKFLNENQTLITPPTQIILKCLRSINTVLPTVI